MKTFNFFGIKRCLVVAACIVSFIQPQISAAQTFNAPECMPGQKLATLPGSNKRISAYAYHKGYLFESEWGPDSDLNIYDFSNPSSPVLRGNQHLNWPGHHNYIGVGSILAWNFAGQHQIRLDDVETAGFIGHHSKLDGGPQAFMKPALPLGDRRKEQMSYFPYGFAGVPHAYPVEGDPFKRSEAITIHDQRLPGNPEVGRIEFKTGTPRENEFQGRVSMIGNLLIIRGDHQQHAGIAIYDISNPEEPEKWSELRLSKENNLLGKSYDSMPFWGHHIVLANNSDAPGQHFTGVDLVDFSDPRNPRHVSRMRDLSGNTRYAQFKDEFMFVGDTQVDLSEFLNPPENISNDQRRHKIERVFPDAGGEYLLPLGNVLVTGGLDRENNGRVYCLDEEPDTTPPTVAYVNPPDGATRMHVKSRVGILVHETLDLSTLVAENFTIRSEDGEKLDVDVSWMDNDIINITPRELLKADTRYDFIIEEGRVKDVAGNAMERFEISFSTGDKIVRAPVIDDIHLSLASDLPFAGIGEINRIDIQASSAREMVLLAENTLSYSVNWGDGTVTEWSELTTYEHSYAEQGVYLVKVSVRNGFDLVKSRNLSILVEDKHTPIHQSSSSLVYDSSRRHIVNVNPDNNSVTSHKADTGEKVFALDVPNDPRSIAIDMHGDYWVTSLDEGLVRRISGEDGSFLDEVELHRGSQPFGIVIDQVSQYAYVSAMAEGRIYRINLADTSELISLEVGPFPRAMALSSDGSTLLVTRFISAQEQAEIYRINTSSFSNYESIILPIDDSSQDTDTSGRGIPNYLISIAMTPDGKYAWVGGKKDNIRRGLTREPDKSLDLDFQTTLRSMISVVDLEKGEEHSKIDFDNRELVSAINFSLGGELVYITHQGNNSLALHEVKSMQELSSTSAGIAPMGIAMDSQRGEVYVHGFLSRTIEKLSPFSQYSGNLGVLYPIQTIETIEGEDVLEADVLAGKKLFYDASNPEISRDSYISCAACHLDGGSDARVWDFTGRGEGLRNTINLTGRGGTLHGRVHWSANFDEIQDFEHDMRGPFGGRGLLHDDLFSFAPTSLGATKDGLSEKLDQLALYVASLNSFAVSPHREGDQLTFDAQEGKQVFARYKCGSCHQGEAFTDSPLGLRHDVGTISQETSGQRLYSKLDGIDTPTLRGLWESAPYLHDGSAATLYEVLNNSAHGASDQLSELEREQLVAYLLQIDGLEPAAEESVSPAEITSIQNGDVLGSGSIPLNIALSFEENVIVEWMINGEVFDIQTEAPYDVVWAPEQNGEYRIYARVTYNSGQNILTTPEHVISVASVNNLLSSSGEFNNSFESFETFIKDNIVGRLTSNGEARMEIWGAQEESWHVQMYHRLSLNAGKEYTICYDARADEDRAIDVNIDSGEEPHYSSLMPASAKPMLATTYRSFQHTFVANRGSAHARLTFNVGAHDADVSIDNIGVYQGSSCPLQSDPENKIPLDEIKIEAESFSFNEGLQLERSFDVDGSDNIGFADPGDYLIYDMEPLPETGNYRFSFRTAGLLGLGRVTIQSRDGLQNFAVFDQAGGTGGWQSWQTRHIDVTLPKGLDSFRIFFNDGAVNFNWYGIASDYDRDGVVGTFDKCEDTLPNVQVDSEGCPFVEPDCDGDGVPDERDQCPGTRPGVSVNTLGCESNFSVTIEAEDSIDQRGTQTENTMDQGGGLNVGFTDQGDWLSYKRITIPKAGEYHLKYRLAGLGAGTIRLDVDNLARRYTEFHGSGDWQNWTSVEDTVMLPAGDINLTLAIHEGWGININWFSLEFVREVPVNMLSSDGTITNQGTFEHFLVPEAQANIAYNNEVHVTIGHATSEIWKVQVIHGVDIRQDQQYTICFDARAAGRRKLNFNVDTGVDQNFASLIPGDGRNAELDIQYQHFNYTFVANDSDESARLVLNLGDNHHDVWIDNIGIYPGLRCGVP